MSITDLFGHYDDAILVVGALYTIASVVVKLTPTPKDDAVLHQIVEWVSFLKPKGVGVLKVPFTSTKDE